VFKGLIKIMKIINKGKKLVFALGPTEFSLTHPVKLLLIKDLKDESYTLQFTLLYFV
jgi:hypothetical protein